MHSIISPAWAQIYRNNVRVERRGLVTVSQGVRWGFIRWKKLTLAMQEGKEAVGRSLSICPPALSLLPHSIRERDRGSLDLPFLNWLRTCLIHINDFSTLHPLTWRPGRKSTELPFFIPIPSGTEAGTICLLTVLGKGLPYFIWSGSQLLLPLIIFFLCNISSVVLSINKPSLVTPSSQVTLCHWWASPSGHRDWRVPQESL